MRREARQVCANPLLWSSQLAAVTDEIKALGGKAFAFKIDLTNRTAVYELAKKIQAEV